ncbi:MAG: snapalysin family zinc-dependent metalloprotease [Agathobacter sp.]|nr:snapalysin family zinc-dependent metalloprotease [Agathobacter sp.]MBQ2902684.1 snapalysin family zinc-dependent metalloprotease [Agathobacter sp.]
MKRIKIIPVFSIILLFVFVSPVYAHTTSQIGVLEQTYHTNPNYQDYYVGGEEVGWSIDETLHTNGTSITYSFAITDPYLETAYKVYAIEGASKWNGIVNITNKLDGTGKGIIKTYNEENSGTVDRFRGAYTDANGHLTSWIIEMNRSYNVTSTTLAHEFGHVIGLNDLYASKNTNKLMYGYSSRSVSSPPYYRLKGLTQYCVGPYFAL